MYEIIGYDVVNGKKQYHNVTNKTAVTIAEIDAFEAKKAAIYKRRWGVDVQIFSVYRRKIEVKL